MYMTNKKVLEEARNIVKVHAPLILKELGLEENDGILDRIFVTAEVSATTPHGVCHATTQETRRLFEVIKQEYVKGSAKIEINPLTFFHYMNKKGEIKEVPFFFRFFKSKIRRMILFTLAHELRHYWQHYTGEYYKNELMFFGRSIMPYEMRWCEEDANKFGVKYIKEEK
jgi:hypothetical protein